MTNRSLLLSQLEEQMRTDGYPIPEFNFNGEYIRFSKDGSSKNNCWFVGSELQLNNGGIILVCSYGDWKTGEKHDFKSFNGQSEHHTNELKEKVETLKIAHEEKKQELQKQAALKAHQMLAKAKAISVHRYLNIKHLPKIYGVKQIFNLLLVPMQNVDGTIMGLQTIDPEGKKRFLSGQATKGLFFIIGHNSSIEELKSAYVAEGFATAASIYLAERKPVICVFTANNISNVCAEIKKKNKLIRLVICADNDQYTEGNPGVTKATEAAQAYSARLAIPEFKDSTLRLTDFNDIHVQFGLAEVKAQLKKAKFLKEENPISAYLAEDYLTQNQLIIKNLPLLRCYQGDFFEYQKNRYKQLSDSDLFCRVIAFLQNGSGVKTKSTPKLTLDIIGNLKGIGLLDSSISIPSWLDDPSRSAAKFLPLKNGILNIEKWLAGEVNCLEPHNPHFFSTVCLNVEYIPEATCKVWKDFVNDVLPHLDDQRLLQQWFGYNLTPDVSFHKFIIFLGEGANGKSVVCEALTALLGPGNVSSVGLEGFNPNRTFPLADTVGKLANIVSELNNTTAISEGELKKFVAGNLMFAERKFKHPFSFIPTAKLTYATNALPEFKDTSDGVKRRLIILPFNVQIPPDRQNKDFGKASYWQNHPDLSGILNWALNGLRDLYNSNGFCESVESAKRSKDYFKDLNPTRQFLEDHYELSPGESVACFCLARDYETWMKLQGHLKLSSQRLAEEVRRVFPDVIYTENPTSHTPEELLKYQCPPRGRRYLNLKELK